MITLPFRRRWVGPALALAACALLYVALPRLEKPLGGSGIGMVVELADTWVFLTILLLALWVGDPCRGPVR